ncbi:hypothetical protein FIE12Z_10874 [Fusarium flagelliforme]|uniref:EKC/KEOPS complex subunit BUD32 n=1 Tax=Fusarium flagelliforme TaxID=2675880 RepID=A0A395MC72_9HYPO|nr:hypothetical protein FIE12Z_10874 [Fusarium flagelliforme]
MADPTAAPLLHSQQTSYKSISPHGDGEIAGDIQPSRHVEDDVLPETSTIGRNLSWQSAYVIVISRVVGSGIFATPGTIVQSVGSPGLALSLWLLGAFIAACGLGVSLEFGCMLPRSGADKVYLEFAYQRPRLLASTLFAMYAVLLGFTASNCVVFSQYVLFALGVDKPSDELRKSLAVGLLTFVCVTHSIFPKAGIRIQNILGWVKIGIIVFMILSGFYVVIIRPDTSAAPTGQLAWGHLWDDSSWSWGIIATSLFKVFYSFAGLDNAANVMNEVKHPVRTLRSVALTALVTSCGLYMLINVAYLLVVPIGEIKESGELIAALFFERLFGESFGRIVLPTAVALSAIGNVMVVAFAMARTKQEIARQGFIPYSSILSSSRPFNSPMGGFVIHYVPSFLVLTLPSSDTIYSFILNIDGYAGQLIGLAVAIGLVKLRLQRPDLKRPFKAWMLAVVLKIAMSCALIMAPFFPPQGDGFYAMIMINEDEKYFCLSGDIPVGGPSTWHVVNWDQRRVVSVTMDGEQDDDALAIEHYSRHSEELSPEVYRIYVSETGEIITKYIDAKYDMNYCIHYPSLEDAVVPEEIQTVRRDELEEIERLGPDADLVAYPPRGGNFAKKVVFKYYFLWQYAKRSWKEMNLWMRLPPHPNVVPFDRVVIDELESRVVGFTSVYVPGRNLEENRSRVFKLKWLKQLTKVVDDLNLGYGISHQDIAPRNLLIDETTDSIMLFDFNYATRISHIPDEGEAYVEDRNDVKGIIFTIYEIITQNDNVRSIPHEDQSLSDLESKWAKHPDVKLDQPVESYQLLLQEWQKRREDPMEAKDTPSIRNWPSMPKPPQKNIRLRKVGGEETQLTLDNFYERRQDVCKRGENVLN